MVSNVFTRSLIPGLLSLCLAGCGFKLAGTTSLSQSLNSIYLVTTNLNEPQHEALTARLESAGTTVSTQADSGAPRLAVSFKVIPDRTLVSGASTGKTVARLARRLDYSLKSADGKMLVEPKTLVQQKNIVLDDDNLLASTQEKADVIKDLEQALINQLIHQLKRL